MNIFNTPQAIMDTTDEFLFSASFPETARLTATAFTRERSLSCIRLTTLILLGVRLPLQLALDEYFEAIRKEDETVSQQAASKARTNLTPDVFKHLFLETVRIMNSVSELKLWLGKYRLGAIDGTDLAINNSEELKQFFGCAGRGSKAATAKCSMFFDPLNNIILDAILAPYVTSERKLAQQNILAAKQLPFPPGVEFLYIMDRGYPSFPLMPWLMERNMKFLIRVRQDFAHAFSTNTPDEDASFRVDGKDLSVRVIRVVLSSGETEILLTNLDSTTLPVDQAGELYFKRWGIETKFNSLKNKLELENMSGRRMVTLLQDFWATLYLANLLASLKWKADAMIELSTQGKNNKYKQKTNENRLIRKLRRLFIHSLSQPDPYQRSLLFDRLIADVSKYPEPVKPDRSVPRKIPRESKFHDCFKSLI